MNEVPTIILVSVVFLAVFKNLINWWYLGIGVLGFTSLIGYAIYKVQKRGGL